MNPIPDIIATARVEQISVTEVRRRLSYDRKHHNQSFIVCAQCGYEKEYGTPCGEPCV